MLFFGWIPCRAGFFTEEVQLGQLDIPSVPALPDLAGFAELLALQIFLAESDSSRKVNESHILECTSRVNSQIRQEVVNELPYSYYSAELSNSD